ncbi:MAG: D-cysteine desulfhydrase family protein [Gammaproteobacteria bacterium]|nr:D-cysteine desulfhydrase family protein [Gammaproteobacteria bacterium]
MSKDAFNSIPKEHLLKGATPLHELKNLSLRYDKALLVKRDDLSGVGIGGNKVRKLEYLLAEAKNNGAKSVITGGGIQSNHAAATAICAKMLGMDSYLALVDAVPIVNEHYSQNGNVVIDKLCDANIKVFSAGKSVNERIREFAADIEQKTGEKPFEICMGGSSAIGALGYVSAALEMAEQFELEGINSATVTLASGSAGTQAGLIAGFALAKRDVKILGCSVLHPKEVLAEMVRELCLELAQVLALPDINWDELINIDDGYIGEGYGIPSQGTWQAIKTGIAEEAILFDPCYSGKAFNYFLDLLENSSPLLKEHNVFLMTGGLTGLFGYQHQVQAQY